MAEWLRTGGAEGSGAEKGGLWLLKWVRRQQMCKGSG